MSDVKDTPEVVPDEPVQEPSYTFDDVTLTDTQIREMHKRYGDGVNWQNSLHEKGRLINNQAKKLETDRGQLDKDKVAWDNFKNSQNKQTVVDKEKWDGEMTLAEAKLIKEFEDFDYAKIVWPFLKKHDLSGKTPSDFMRLGYLAEKGARMEELTADARAGVVREAKKKKGLPPTGKKEPIMSGEKEKKEYNTLEDLKSAMRG